jgi:CRISPR-associated protein Cmr3
VTRYLVTFEPLDSWFFRDGTPFGEGITIATGIHGVFPPPVSTLQGALRTAIAEANGWPLDQPLTWPYDWGRADRPGPLTIMGPLILTPDGEYRWPLPRVVWADSRGELSRLAIGPSELSDLGVRRLPHWKPRHRLVDGWVSVADLSRLLSDPLAVPSMVVSNSELFRSELHVGIQRARQRVVDGGLFVVHHARPEPGVRVAVVVEGIPDAVYLPDRVVVRLGGEGRPAVVTVRTAPPSIWPTCPALKPQGDHIRYFVSILTPLQVHPDGLPLLGGPTDRFGRVASASVGPPLRMGGYDLQERAPRPLATYLRAGSTWFLEAPIEVAERIQAVHGRPTGRRPELGEGLAVVGRWEDAK